MTHEYPRTLSPQTTIINLKNINFLLHKYIICYMIKLNATWQWGGVNFWPVPRGCKGTQQMAYGNQGYNWLNHFYLKMDAKMVQVCATFSLSDDDHKVTRTPSQTTVHNTRHYTEVQTKRQKVAQLPGQPQLTAAPLTLQFYHRHTHRHTCNHTVWHVTVSFK